MHLVSRGTGTPKDTDEVNRRDVCECDGCVCDLELEAVFVCLLLRRKRRAERGDEMVSVL